MAKGTNLIHLMQRFSNEDDARDYLEGLRWPHGAVCPKCGTVGVYHHCSRGHLHRYLSEFDFRYNGRKINDGERAVRVIGMVGGKRLTFKPLSRRAS